LRYTLADYVWLGDNFEVPVDITTWNNFMGDVVEAPVTTITSAYEPEIDFLDTEAGTFATSGKRNVSWLLDASGLTLTELKSL
jgi:hypothetical protein